MAMGETMKTPEQPCLYDYIEAFDAPGPEPDQEGFLMKSDRAERKPSSIREWLTCTTQECDFTAMITRRDKGPCVNFTSDNPTHRKECLRRAPEHSVAFGSTSPNGCMAAATAYALKKHGSTVTPETVDGWLQREPGELPTHIGEYMLKLRLLESGYMIRNVFPERAVNYSRLSAPNSDYTFEDYKSSFLEVCDNETLRQYFDGEAAQRHHDGMMEYMSTFNQAVAKYRREGLYREEYRNASITDVAEWLRSWSVIACRKTEDIRKTEVAFHAVVVEHVRHITGGWVRAEYYDPAADGQSRISVDRRPELEDIFCPHPDYGYMLVRAANASITAYSEGLAEERANGMTK